MSDFAELIKATFACDHIPTKDELVKFDGFDEPGKEWTLKFFLGKKRDEVERLVNEGEMGTMSYVESLSIMEPYGFQYYLPAYLLYVLRVQNLDEDDTAHFTFFFLNEALRIRGNILMTDDQIRVVESVSKLILEKLIALTSEDESGCQQSMIENIRSILEKLAQRFVG